MMTNGRKKAAAKGSLSSSICVWCAILALMGTTLTLNTGCDEEAALLAFRDAATSDLESGVKSIMDGLIEGIFAAVDPGSTTDTTAGDTTQ
jgi:hypothetical protein